MMVVRRSVLVMLAAIASAALFAGLPANLARAASFDSISQIYAYGDSYTDSGASFAISNWAVEAGVADATLFWTG